LLNQAGIAQRQAPFAALSLYSPASASEEETDKADLVANLQGDILWMKTNSLMALESGFE
jgi:hypothetical protein